MREFDALAGYPEPASPRLVSPKFRTIKQRIIASYRGREFYDGDRNSGYGGFEYDGRWLPIARNFRDEYLLDASSKVLQIGAEKGFLLHDLQETVPGISVTGTEISEYARHHAMEEIRPLITDAQPTEIPFPDDEFDLVIALGTVYTLNLSDALQCLREIQRVSRGESFVTLGSYTNQEDYWLFKHWTVLGATILMRDEWLEVMRHAGYTGDYKFTGADSLKLQWAKE